jgi:epoxyqueuosine reductase
MLARPQMVNPPLDWLAGMDAAEFKRWFKGSPVERTGRKRLHRNVAIAMGNTGERRFFPQLETWASAEDPILAEAAQGAIQRIRTLEGHGAQPPANQKEEDPGTEAVSPASNQRAALLASE